MFPYRAGAMMVWSAKEIGWDPLTLFQQMENQPKAINNKEINITTKEKKSLRPSKILLSFGFGAASSRVSSDAWEGLPGTGCFSIEPPSVGESIACCTKVCPPLVEENLDVNESITRIWVPEVRWSQAHRRPFSVCEDIDVSVMSYVEKLFCELFT